MVELWQRVDEINDLLSEELARFRESGCQLAENEAEYRKALRVAILNERAAGTPVTIVSDVCRGREDIAELRLARDCSEAIYKASGEAINIYKLRLRMLNEQIGREWSSGGNGGIN